MSGGSAINKVKNENELISKNETDSFSAAGNIEKEIMKFSKWVKSKTIYFQGKNENALISRTHIRIYRVEELKAQCCLYSLGLI